MKSMIFYSYTSKATYLFNGQTAICINPGNERPVGMIASGFDPVEMSLFIDSQIPSSRENVYFVCNSPVLVTCSKEEAEYRGYKVLFYFKYENDDSLEWQGFPGSRIVRFSTNENKPELVMEYATTGEGRSVPMRPVPPILTSHPDPEGWDIGDEASKIDRNILR